MTKSRLIRALRAAGLLTLVEHGRLVSRRATARAANRRFAREHPDFAIPPAELMFDALAHIDLAGYRASGMQHATGVARIVDAAFPDGPLELLEWGCGPGRLIRHMPSLLASHPARIVGSDYNPRTVRWCAEHLDGIAFVQNGLRPPLPLAGARFDVAYCISVFTHLSEDVQLAWADELRRVLKPGGLLICTTQGDNYRHLLADPGERARYAAGEVVVQGNYAEGRKWFLAIHPDRFIRERLLGGYTGVQRISAPTEYGFAQDMWVAWKDVVPEGRGSALERLTVAAGPPNGSGG
jgi:SAM-dependent methyltransferase